MSPNPKLALDLEGGPLKVAVISPDPELALALRRAVRVRRDIVVVTGSRNCDVLVWDTGDDGRSTPLRVSGASTLALASNGEAARLALAAGAQGVVPRDVEISSLIAAVIATRYGLSVQPLPEAPSKTELGDVELTDREAQVLEQLASGAGNRAIAAALDISEHTVKFHIGSLLTKLEVETRTAAVVQGLKRGLLTV